MNKRVNFAKVRRNVYITDLLNSLGYRPVKTNGSYWLYHSPFRRDEHPSFSVQLNENRWCDFALGVSGSVIDLAMRLGYGDTAREAALYLSDNFILGKKEICETNVPTLFSKRADTVQIQSISDLTHPALLDYIVGVRRISEAVARQYTKEVHYSISGKNKECFSIGFLNRSGGFELRNKLCHLASSPKDITILPGTDRTKCIVFEGFMDFLSYVVLEDRGSFDVIVLNSVALTRKAISAMGGYERIECFLDNDDPGRRAYALIAEARDHVFDKSSLYEGFKDFNEYHTNSQI